MGEEQDINYVHVLCPPSSRPMQVGVDADDIHATTVRLRGTVNWWAGPILPFLLTPGRLPAR